MARAKKEVVVEDTVAVEEEVVMVPETATVYINGTEYVIHAGEHSGLPEMVMNVLRSAGKLKL